MNTNRDAKATRRSRSLLLTALAVVGLLLSPALWATTYYVDQNHPNASDSNPGTAEAPWRTLYRINEQRLQPGDTVLVKEGRYQIDHGGDWRRASIRPQSSGAPGKPITIRSSPRHAAELIGSGGEAPLIGVYAQDHVVIDGFVVSHRRGGKGIAVFGTQNRRVQGVVVQNNIISGIYARGGDNADGIRLEHNSNTTVRNNKIFDVSNDQNTSNAAGIKLYWSDRVVIEHNEIFDVVAGIKEKENGEFVDIRRNYVHRCGFGVEVMNQNNPVTQGYRIYENVFACSTGVEGKTVSTATMKDIFIYNNVFLDYTGKALNGTRHGSNRRVWNNIFYRTKGTPSQGEFFTYNDPPREIELMDFNLYSVEPKNVIGLYASDRTYQSLAAWQGNGHGFDSNSRVGDPLFRDPANGDFRLAAGSPARGAGRVDGRSGGATVDKGAYPRGDGGPPVGLMWGDNAPVPGAPGGLVVD